MWLALTLVSAASGCADGPVTRTGACDVFRPIHPTAPDTDLISDQLVSQLLVHNQTGSRLCGWRPPVTSDVQT